MTYNNDVSGPNQVFVASVVSNTLYQRPVNGAQMCQQPLVSAPKQNFTQLKMPVGDSWKKPKTANKSVENKVPRRAASINSNTSNKENQFQAEQPEGAKEEQRNNNFSFPEGGWV